ncbi:hypothetical protein GSU68_19265 (plasmid) [Rathayibacter sp. VKM Ac-2759]|uniref:hypothetical protein n=1 Tax=Rathayibacter sp. VKM Ac-2759 TaxID=2609252 RepID=UPI001318F2A4|nr:hypothetical protein [Rathayibacter sp. VKM Ac-2759]QHC68857.1 hypothetical protein GSU68_19265 [Rathayibacter sp. VKM Ac-2759]
MSFEVRVVCEDHTLDQYVAIPVVKAVMTAAGKPRANVKVVTSPQLRGISHVETHFASLASRYAEVADLVIFALDRDKLDGQDGRGDRKASFADKVAELPLSVQGKVEILLAVEETEVWAMWGSKADIPATWAEVRAERDSKEMYFDPLVTTSDHRQPGLGRTRLVALSLNKGWASISAGCPELRELEASVRAKL